MSKKHENYVATPIGVLATIMSFTDARAACDVLAQHMRQHYGPLPGIVIDEEGMRFVKLERE
jgi:hypothetical protein